MIKSLEKNVRSVDYLGLDRIALFEIGRVYRKEGEEKYLCIAVQNKNKTAKKKYGTEKEQLEKIVHEIFEIFNSELNVHYEGNSVSIPLADLYQSIKSVSPDGLFDAHSYRENSRYHGISVYPYTSRDISFWAGESFNPETIIDEFLSAKVKFLKKVFPFDSFEKDGRKSYAYSFIFQSNEKTLTDIEVERDMEILSGLLAEKGCEIR